MKLFLKILLFILTMMFITVGEIKSSIVVNILHDKFSVSLLQEAKSFSIGLKNLFENSCNNGEKVLTYSEWVRGIEARATKGGIQYTKSSLKIGQEMHKAYKVGAEGVKEFRLPSGKRIDFLDINNRTIRELKPAVFRIIFCNTLWLKNYSA